ncbi:TPA: hypothetical protein ACXJGG_003938 [Pseudomonas aeruginosa]
MNKANECTCPSGDGSLVHPCPAHPAVEQAGGDERAAFEAWATHLPMDRQPLRPDLYMPQTQWAWEAWQFRAALAHPSPAQAEAERPEVVARVVHSNPVVLGQCGPLNANDELMTVAQHAASVARWAEMFNRVEQERDAALARVVELDQALAEKDPFGAKLNRISEKLERCDALLAARAAQAGQVPQAWIDVQAERRRQIEAEGWTPEHDDAHSHGQMARAAACYALAGSSAPNDGTAALLVSLAWPWDEQWWKPSTARRDLVKACALALAEIERLDRAGISQSPQPGATTASS